MTPNEKRAEAPCRHRRDLGMAGRCITCRGVVLDGLVVDSFAGGGGASTGIEAALGRPVDIAINHDPEAIAMHAENHPATRHFCESVWKVDPMEATGGRPVVDRHQDHGLRHRARRARSGPEPG